MTKTSGPGHGEHMPSISPVISIGMPVYNGAAYLAQALESLLTQTFHDFEVIISDNASSDQTAGIIAGFAARDSRIRAIRQKENIGPQANFSFVLKEARAPYFMWAAHDDWRDANYFEALHNAISSDPEIEMAVPRIVRQRMDGTIAEITELPAMCDGTRVKRVTRMLTLCRGGTIYSLYRTTAIRETYARVVNDFPHVWASDHLIIFPFFINDHVISVPQTSFYNRETGLSAKTYRPETTGQQWRFQFAFFRYAAGEIMRSRLKIWEKLICLLFLISYSNSKAIKWRRLLLGTLMSPLNAGKNG